MPCETKLLVEVFLDAASHCTILFAVVPKLLDDFNRHDRSVFQHGQGHVIPLDYAVTITFGIVGQLFLVLCHQNGQSSAIWLTYSIRLRKLDHFTIEVDLLLQLQLLKPLEVLLILRVDLLLQRCVTIYGSLILRNDHSDGWLEYARIVLVSLDELQFALSAPARVLQRMRQFKLRVKLGRML